MAVASSVWTRVVAVIAALAFVGAGFAMAVPIGEISDSNCGWAWQAIGRTDTPVCDGPGWRRIGLAVALVVIASALLLAGVLRGRRVDAPA
jgi:hypothetical protein